MRDNLLFTGIQENDLTNRDTVDTLCTFIATQMNIKDEIPFERVHRLGRYKPDQEKPRPIIAKFHRFKDRVKVRQLARHALTGTQYGVKEQFPIEVEAKRRTLYPIMKKQVKTKKTKCVWCVIDFSLMTMRLLHSSLRTFISLSNYRSDKAAIESSGFKGLIDQLIRLKYSRGHVFVPL